MVLLQLNLCFCCISLNLGHPLTHGFYPSYSDHGDNTCRTITYYANLTQAYEQDDWMGNCFLKSGRPADIARSGDAGIDWEHTISAYMSCLVNGAC